MESRIPENLRLLSLIVKNTPFQYNGEFVQADYNMNIEISELESYKSKIEQELSNESEKLTDEEKRMLSDDIYLLSSVIDDLKNKTV